MTQPPGRPRISSRSAIEAAAMRLFLDHGYDATSVESVAEASGVSRATFFRYFASKSEVVLREFDLTIARLRVAMDEDPAAKPLIAVRNAVVSTTRTAAQNPTWIDRFVLMDSDPALRRDIADHWAAWMKEISQFVAGRTGLDPSGVEAAAVAGAFHAAYVAIFRHWSPEEATAVDRLMDELHAGFDPLLEPLSLLIAQHI